MMSIELLAEKRVANKRARNELRRNGKIPATIYSHGKAESLAIDLHEYTIFRRNNPETTMLTLNIGKKKRQALIKEVQPHAVTDVILHIDFLEVHKGEELHASVPLHFEGSAVGVREGGILERHLHELEVSCLPVDLPEYIAVDVTDLEVGSSLHVSDVQISEKVKILTDGDQVLVVITTPKAEQETTLEEEEEEILEEESEED